MRTADFDYHLPPDLIAQERADPPESARLLILPRRGGAIDHRRVADLPNLLQPDDVLVLNNSRVIPARLFGTKSTGGRVEALLVREVCGEWLAMTRPGLKPGQRVRFDSSRSGAGSAPGVAIEAAVAGAGPDGLQRLRFDLSGTEFRSALAALGTMPTPPYIRRPLRRLEEYQTVYAEVDGSVAAPTAGFHFSPGLFEQLKAHGITWEFVTLHVGPGTFRPVKSPEIEGHRLHAEWFTISEAVAARLNEIRAQGRRLIAIGTTAMRALESAAQAGQVQPFGGDTDIFIYPGYRFQVVDGLMTNFHLPRSTLLMLVCAFAGQERVMRAYEEAVRRRYRFYSFGDAMLIT